MNIEEKIREDMKKAVLRKDREQTETLRFLLSIIQKEAAIKGKLSEEEKIKILQRELKKKKEALELFAKAGRKELEQKEAGEIKLLQNYLPAQLDRKSLREIIRKKISQNPDLSFGELMGKVMAEVKTSAEGKVVAEVLKEEIVGKNK
jgi:uncharacterized protein YqeY